MKHLIVLFFICTTLFVTQSYGEDCSTSRSYTPEACLFSGSLKGISGSAYANLCYSTNLSPLTATPYGSNSGVCADKVYQDGNACIEFYAKMMCSSSCIACNQFICKDFCTNAVSTCPLAAAAGCFGTLSYCADSNTGCTNWNVDMSKIPSAPTTTTTKQTASTTTKTSSQSQSTTSTQSSLTSSSNNLSVSFMFIQIFAVVVLGTSFFAY